MQAPKSATATSYLEPKLNGWYTSFTFLEYLSMPDLADGESTEMKGSGAKPYVIKNVGGVFSCSCPAWRNQSIAIERRTCKHIRKLRGDAEEEARIGGSLPQKPVKATDDAGEGPPILLAETWDTAADLSGWWMSEKLDGVRAYWDGKQFISRQGNLYHAPDWFVAGLPGVPLDGELWLGRKAFQRTVGIVRRQDKTDLWKEVKYLIFDAPNIKEPFERRMKFLAETIRDQAFAHAALHPHELCKNVDHLREELQRVEALGGEGLMLRQPGSLYEVGRSTTLVKVKTFKDAEATVIGHQGGTGKHKGRLGALQVRLADGTEFSVGTGFADRQRESPPAIGSLITFRYQELSDGGVPRFPSFVGVRADVAGTEAGPAVPAQPEKKTKGSSAVAPSASKGARRFEYEDESSSKFWEVAVDGCNLTTTWGKIGTGGQSKTKTFATVEKAVAEMNKLIEEKTGKGYEEK
jgi:DNA ligase-1